MKKYIFILVMIVFVVSCKSLQHSSSMSGVYENRYATKIFNSRISCIDKVVLKPDSTFTVSFVQGVVALKGEGKWQVISNDSILFESFNFPVFEKFGYGEGPMRDLEQRKVRVMNGGGKLKFPKRVSREGRVLEYTIVSKIK